MESYQAGKDICDLSHRVTEIERRLASVGLRGADERAQILQALNNIAASKPGNDAEVQASFLSGYPQFVRFATEYETYKYEWDNNGGSALRRVTVAFDKQFSRAQIDFLKTAVSHWISHPFSNQPCVGTHGSAFKRDRSKPFPYWLPYELEEFLVMNMTIYYSTYVNRNGSSPPGPRQSLFIDRISVPPTGTSWLLGQGGVNYFNDFGHLRIELNEQAIGPSSSYFRAQDPVHWAGVILHEVLHNLGFNHADASDPHYDDAFIVAYELCYTGGLSLVGPQGHRGVCGNRQEIFGIK